MKKICLISPGHISCNPRLLKEATSLDESGYDVTVICGKYFEPAIELDKEVIKNLNFKILNVFFKNRYERLFFRIVSGVSLLLTIVTFFRFTFLNSISFDPIVIKYLLRINKIKSDLYIAHYPASLYPAFFASKKFNRKFSFDAEDYHLGENRPYLQRLLISRIEDSLIKNVAYLSTSSPMISSIYKKSHNISPYTILNVFDISSQYLSEELKNDDRIKIYWFSQTIGPNRGLEEILDIFGLMNTKISLYLRGYTEMNKEYKRHLEDLSQRKDILLFFYDITSPHEMVYLASEFDLGLSIEPGFCINNNICLGNKIFTYISAGIPVLLSNTPAQKELSKDLSEAAILIDIHEENESAKILDDYFSDPKKLQKAKKYAKEISINKYNWDIEKKKFIDIVNKSLN